MLALQRARAAGKQQVGAERIQQRRVVRIVHHLLVEAADGDEELLDVVLFDAIERDRPARPRAGCVQHVFDDARDRGEGDLRRDEQRIAVAALEADLLLGADAGVLELAPAGRRGGIFQARAEAFRMAAAADGFAVGVEHHQLDVGEAAIAQQVGQLQPQPFDRDRGHRLAEMPAGIGEAGLDAEPPALPHIGGEVRVLQALVDHADAALERLGGLEQGRDVDLGLDPEQLGEIERRQQRQRRFAFRRSGSAPAWSRRCISASAPRS